MSRSTRRRKQAGLPHSDSRSKPGGANTAPLDSARRPTGIRVMGDVPWGTHICVFYDTKEDLLDTNAAYFQAGLESNEFCVWAVTDPVTVPEAQEFLQRNISGFDRFVEHFEILPGHEWYLKGAEVDPRRITAGWHEKLEAAQSKGFEGLRVSGNAFWIETNQWEEFSEYERELDDSLAGRNMMVMCTYSLKASRAVDLLDVTRAHNFSLARRKGDWEFLETPELREARQEIQNLRSGMDVLSNPFPGHDLLTPRERVVLAQIVRGASSKEAAKTLRVSPRTIEFHRLNVMQKLGAKNVAELMVIVLGEI